MYTASAIAEKAHVKPAEVRYFARKYNIPKITIENKQVFIFDKKDYRLFLLYKHIGKKKKRIKSNCTFHFMIIRNALYKSKTSSAKKMYSVKKC